MTANRAVEQMFGVLADEVIGRPYTEVFPGLYQGFDTTFGRLRVDGTQQIFEINTVLPERGPSILNLRLTPLMDSTTNRIQGVAIVIDDVTEIRRHNETIRVVNTYLSEEMVSNIQSIDNLGLGGEDREISVVFADVRGFTTFSEQLEPEEVMSVINQYLSVSSHAVQTTQGVIDKFMGDAILALYNTQLNPQDDHPIRAVQAAIAMRDNVLKLHHQLPPSHQLFYGIGIHTGLAAIGNIGSPSRKEFTAIGEAIVYAKKLQECARGGEIVVSETTYQQVKRLVEAEQVERQMRNGEEYYTLYVIHHLK
jgi:adenylate cyclase